MAAALPGLVAPQAAELTALLLRAYGSDAPSHWRRRVHPLFERLTIPGLALHQALRKQYIERMVRTAIAEGCPQVVVIGGGLDTLSLRLARELPDIVFIELDHPATQQVKRDLVTRRGLGAANLTFAATDLSSEPLADALQRATAYDAHRATVFVCEGVLMYLGADQVGAVFRTLQQQPARPLRFIFTFMEPDRSGRAAFHGSTPFVRLWLRLRGEPFRWALHRRDAGAFLAQHDFVLRELADESALRPAGSREVVACGELVCVAEVTGSR